MTVDILPAEAARGEQHIRVASRLWPVLAVIGLALAGALLRYVVFAVQTGQSGPLAYFDALCVWDCGWYKTIIQTGYDLEPGTRLRPGAANWAFFPLYPLMVDGLTTLTQLPVTVAGFLLSTTIIVAATVASRPLFEGNDRAYWLCAFMVMVGPFSFLFNTIYTESLFILLTVLALVSLKRGEYVTAGLFSAFLSATRVTGVLMVFGIVAQALQDHLKGGGTWRGFPARVLTDTRLLLSIFLAPVGLFAYMAFLYFRAGDALAFAHIQRAWNRDIGNPFEVLWGALALPWPPTPDAMVIMSWAWGAVVGLLLTLVLAARGRWPAAIFCGLTLLASLAGGITSMIRFSAGLYPLGIAASELLAGNRLLLIFAVIAAVIMDVVLMSGWLRSSLFVM